MNQSSFRINITFNEDLAKSVVNIKANLTGLTGTLRELIYYNWTVIMVNSSRLDLNINNSRSMISALLQSQQGLASI
jgi:hypothetical protein